MKEGHRGTEHKTPTPPRASPRSPTPARASHTWLQLPMRLFSGCCSSPGSCSRLDEPFSPVCLSTSSSVPSSGFCSVSGCPQGAALALTCPGVSLICWGHLSRAGSLPAQGKHCPRAIPAPCFRWVIHSSSVLLHLSGLQHPHLTSKCSLLCQAIRKEGQIHRGSSPSPVTALKNNSSPSLAPIPPHPAVPGLNSHLLLFR